MKPDYAQVLLLALHRLCIGITPDGTHKTIYVTRIAFEMITCKAIALFIAVSFWHRDYYW